MNWDILVIDKRSPNISIFKGFKYFPSSEERKVIGHSVLLWWVKVLYILTVYFAVYLATLSNFYFNGKDQD